MLAEEFIPCFRGAYCYFIDINNDRRFPNTSGVHRGQLIYSKGFGSANFPFAKASFAFVGGKNITSTLNRTCKVSGK